MIFPQTQDRINGNIIDLGKLIMAITVISIHTYPIANMVTRSNSILFDLITKMAVPFFFMSTGYLLCFKISVFPDSHGKIAYLKKYLNKIAKIYLVSSVIYLPLAIAGYMQNGRSLFRNIAYYIRGLLFVGEHYNSWHLWYLLSTIYALIIIMFMIRPKLTRQKLVCLAAVMLSLSIATDEIANYGGTLPPFLGIIKKFINLTVINGRIFHGAIYIPVGFLVVRRLPSLKLCVTVLCVSFVSNYFIDNSAITGLLLAVSSIALFCASLHIKLDDHFVYKLMRKLSTLIYLIHMYVWTFYYMLAYGEKSQGWDSFAVTTLVSMGIGSVYLWLKKWRKSQKS